MTALLKNSPMKHIVENTTATFREFTGLHLYLIIGDLVISIVGQIYKKFKEHILDPFIDPIVPDDWLEFKIWNSKMEIGLFIVELFKQCIFIFINYWIFVQIKRYTHFKSFQKKLLQ